MKDPHATLVLNRFNCVLMGWEEKVECPILANFGLQAYKDKAGNIRVFKPGQVGIIIAKDGRDYRIQHVYTLPILRRRGLARELLAACRLAFGKVNHCHFQSNAGRAWCRAVA